MSIGKVQEFDVKSGNWTAYVERLEMYFLANKIEDKKIRLATMIAVMGEGAYDLLSALASPKKPSALEFTDAVKLLTDHLQPKPSKWTERYLYRRRVQKDGETVNDYVADLRKLSRKCEFDLLLEDNLCDQLICGIRSEVIRQRLMSDKDLTYEKAYKLAVTLEAAERDSALVEASKLNVASHGNQLEEVHAWRADSRQVNRSRGGGARGGGGADYRGGRNGGAGSVSKPFYCTSCGAADHFAANCKFINYVCSKCGINGHLRRVCPLQKTPNGGGNRNASHGQRGGGGGRPSYQRYGSGGAAAARAHYVHGQGASESEIHDSNDQGLDYEEPVMQLSLSDYRPVSVPILVNNRELIMEIDTGSALSCVSKETYIKFLHNLPIKKCNLTLTHYDGSHPLVITCDASAHGIGAVLSQRDKEGRERPVACVSRALTSAERNYSQIQKETLAIVHSVKKFHQYIYGQHFTLRTDHKPLVTIFGPHQGIPNMSASRLQRWAILLSAYDFEIEYVSTDKNIADALSRMIKMHRGSDRSEFNELPEQTYLHFATEALLMDYTQIKNETTRDVILSRVLSYIRDGWPNSLEIEGLRPFSNRKNELYEELGCIMWGYRVVIPSACTGKVLKELHDSHMGIVKTKQLARSYVWWPGIDEAVERVCRACEVCASVADAPPAHTPRVWHWPARPWSRLHVDYLGPIGGVTYLVTIDAGSKWMEIIKVNSTSAKIAIRELRALFSRFGLPKQMVSDNGPPFSSEEFELFLKNNGIEHLFSAPYHPASNGAAENAVRVCKKVIKKANAQGLDVEVALQRYLLIYRNTEHCTTGVSPAKFLQGRSLRTRLDCLKPERERQVQAAQRRQQHAAGGALRDFTDGTAVWYRSYRQGGAKWLAGKIISKLGSTDYSVVSLDGTVSHRHVDQIRLRHEGSVSSPNRPLNSHPLTPHSVLVCPGCPSEVADGETATVGGGGARVGSPAQAPSRTRAPPERTHPPRIRRPPKLYGFDRD